MNKLFQVHAFILFSICIVFVSLTAFKRIAQDYIPIWFQEYGVEIRSIDKIGDTLLYNKSSRENYRFVFYDTKGKCYCERYLNGKLYEKGNFENSLDTLKKYVSTRSSNGRTSPMRVEKYFEPLKDGQWITYKNGIPFEKRNYVLGIIEGQP